MNCSDTSGGGKRMNFCLLLMEGGVPPGQQLYFRSAVASGSYTASLFRSFILRSLAHPGSFYLSLGDIQLLGFT